MIIVIFGLVIRIAVSLLTFQAKNYDINAWPQLGNYTLQRVNIYPFPAYYINCFLPFFLYLAALASYFEKFGITAKLFLKIVFSVFDAAIIYMVYLLSGKSKKAAFLYAINPVSIIVTSIHGQFESIPTFFLLLSVYLWDKKKFVPSFISGSFGIAFKTWPAIFFIPFFKRLKNKKLILILSIIPTIAVLIYAYLYKGPIFWILRVALFHRGIFGGYGPGLLFSLLTSNTFVLHGISTLFLISFVAYSFKYRGKDITDDILNQMLFFFIFSPSAGIQWLMWLAPFLIIKKPRYWWIFFLATSVYMGDANILWNINHFFTVKYLSLLYALGLCSWGSIVLIALKRKSIITRLDAVDDRDNHQKK